MTDGELKGKKFLDYVAKNQRRLRRNLKKNITFDYNLFDDIFQESIIKVYNSIVKNNKEIEDFEQYFFISSKFNFILKQNAEREKTKRRINIDDFCENNDIEDEPYSEIDTETIIKQVRKLIEDKFGEDNTEIFFEYMMLKVQGGMSYNKFSQVSGYPVSKISDVVSKIKQFCKKDKEIKKLSNGLDL